MDRRTGAVVAASFAATAAFWAYTQTLLRGVDLGDTGGFQAAVVTNELLARSAYPLYLALGNTFVRTVGRENPALALNLFSAIAGAVAIALLTGVAARVTRSAAAGLTAGVLFAFSYTWWHQAIIAEVYTLNLALVGACLLALLHHAERPSPGRLALFFAVYALSFGNHLSMILLLVPFTIVLARASGIRALVQPRVIALALGIAALGALQYVPLLAALHNAVGAPAGIADTLRAFWFDVTKADWRDSMLAGIAAGQIGDRLAMAWFDARQQFGIAGLLLAAVGVVRLWRAERSWALLALVALAINFAFAVTYNVGDPHVFFLPGHYFTALLAAAALMPFQGARGIRRHATAIAAAVVLGYAAFRAYDTWPAVDRHADRRADQLIEQITFGLDERSEVLAADLDWQIENVLSYSSRFDRPRVAWTKLADVMLHFPFFVDANHAIGRDVVLTAGAARQVDAAFGSAFVVAPDLALPVTTLEGAVDRLPAGSPYVLAALAPDPDASFDAEALNAVINRLTGGAPPARQEAVYEVMAGVAGQPPSLYHGSHRPFRLRAAAGTLPIDVRMDAWLPLETFRRGGFGHVVTGHRAAMTLERGVSFVWFDRDSRPSPALYAAGLYAPQPRFRIAAGATRMARILHSR